jgi:hypothetical protein
MFKETAKKHAEATEEGNYKLGNKHFDIIRTSTDYLKTENKIDYLYQLINDEDVGIRLWAATYLLPFYEKDALSVLSDIENNKGLIAFTAKMTIEEWKKGNLTDYLSK